MAGAGEGARARLARAGPGAADEAEVAGRWAAGLRGPLRLEDGRALKVVFPGVPGGASGPDFRDAILDAGGDLLRGDVEVHLRASSWRGHGHHLDSTYANVALHFVERNDTGARTTLHASGRAIAVLVAPLSGEAAGFPPPFTPPCALAAARGESPLPALVRLGRRRLRMKAVRVAPLAAEQGAGQALYALALETLGGPANREAFASLARMMPLAALLERAEGTPAGAGRAMAVTAHLKGVAAGIVLRRAGLRPMASPGRRLEAAGALVARLWPGGAEAGWPAAIDPLAALPGMIAGPGMGRAMAIECTVNAILPVALAAGVWPEGEVFEAWDGLPSPGTYGKLRQLEKWLTAGNEKPFGTAARLQGGLLLQADYCAKGECGGRCPAAGV